MTTTAPTAPRFYDFDNSAGHVPAAEIIARENGTDFRPAGRHYTGEHRVTR